MKKNTLAAAALCVLFLLSAQQANTKEKEEAVIRAIQEKYASINNLSFPFSQETRLKDLEEKIISTGKVWFKRPEMMKWQYEEPWKDTIVSDGKKLRYYDSRENQVTEVEIGSVWVDSFGSYTIISILENLDRVFEVRSGKEKTDKEGNILLDSKQKDQESSKQVTIAVDPRTYILRKIITTDTFGNTTVIKLGAAEIDTNIPDSFFILRKPKGASTVTFP